MLARVSGRAVRTGFADFEHRFGRKPEGIWLAEGMSPLEAIRTATLNPARYLGLDKDLGSLEVGKLADLVVIDGDVVKDIRQSDRIAQVMQNGRLYDAMTMNQVRLRGATRARETSASRASGSRVRSFSLLRSPVVSLARSARWP